MRAVALALAAALLATMAGAHPAAAWWRYAEWGLSEDQFVAASHGQPTEDRPGAAAVRAWRDQKRNSIVTVTASGSGTILTYKPLN